MKRRRDERGATAILVAMLAVALMVLAGLTIDFGQAYIGKRNLQKASDAGALAAAQVLSKYPGTCEEVRNAPGAQAAALAAAKTYQVKNREPGFGPSIVKKWAVECDTEHGLTVSFGLEGETPAYFRGLTGSDIKTITTNRQTKAVVEVSPATKTRLRPLAMCSTQLTTGPFVRLDYPKDAPPQCGNASGSWWTVDCPGAPSNSTAVMVEQVKNGCPKGASVASGQTSEQTTGDLTTTLKAACNGGETADGSCLESNPGNLDSGQVAASWQYLVDEQISGLFPVFCAPPACDSTTVNGTGNNATFPVYKLLSAVICGYHFSKTEKYHSSTGECAGLPTDMEAGNDDADNTVNYLVIKYVTSSGTGSNQPSECDLGDVLKCDGGLRRTRIVG